LLIFLDKISSNLGFTEHKVPGIRFITPQSDEFTGVSINIGKILLATRLVSRSYLPLFTTPGIVNDCWGIQENPSPSKR
jgi:hypothetical protein